MAAVPDLRCDVVQRLAIEDRVVSHMRSTGRFMGRSGTAQPVDFVAPDLLRVRDGRATDNWHIGDNLTFLQQIGALPSPSCRRSAF